MQDHPERLRRRVRAAGDLLGVVRTMKGLAAVNLRRFEASAAALAEYSSTIETALRMLLWRRPAPSVVDLPREPSKLIMAVFGSQNGLCGRFDDVIVEHALASARERGGDLASATVLALGPRVTARVMEHGAQPAARLRLPVNEESVTDRATELLDALDLTRNTAPGVRVVLCHNRPVHGRGFAPHTVDLLPVDTDWLRALGASPPAGRVVPHLRAAPDEMLAVLLQRHVFVDLHRAFAESMAAENASRLAAMLSAERRVEERLDTLSGRYHRARQAAITSELLEVVAGYESMLRRARQKAADSSAT